jgi:hypothetical protein
MTMWKDVTGKYDDKPLAIAGDPDGECILIAIDGGATLHKGTLDECKAAGDKFVVDRGE